ncbi:hypothetical protein CP8484711_2331B, partial [Chlamydia psittaci 84-8471/1]
NLLCPTLLKEKMLYENFQNGFLDWNLEINK